MGKRSRRHVRPQLPAPAAKQTRPRPAVDEIDPERSLLHAIANGELDDHRARRRRPRPPPPHRHRPLRDHPRRAMRRRRRPHQPHHQPPLPTRPTRHDHRPRRRTRHRLPPPPRRTLPHRRDPVPTAHPRQAPQSKLNSYEDRWIQAQETPEIPDGVSGMVVDRAGRSRRRRAQPPRRPVGGPIHQVPARKVRDFWRACLAPIRRSTGFLGPRAPAWPRPDGDNRYDPPEPRRQMEMTRGPRRKRKGW